MRVLWCLILLALASCGGGGTAAVVRVSVPGDSLTSGGSLQVTPVRRMQEILGPGYALADESWPGIRAADALHGAAGLPFSNFANLMQAQRPNVAAILYGGADVIGQTDPAQFEADMRQLVDLARQAGAKVVLATIVHHPAFEVQEAPLNAAIERIAVDTGSALADVYAIPPGGFTDGIHPDQAWSDKRAALIAQAIQSITP